MLYPLVLSLLVTIASASPRSRGEPLHRTIEAESGGVNYHHFAQPGTNDPVMVPVPLSDSIVGRSQGATFQVDPNTLQATRVPGAVNAAIRPGLNSVPQSQGATFQVNPNTLQATRLEAPLVSALGVNAQANNQQPQFATPQNFAPQPSGNPQVNQPQPQNTFQNPQIQPQPQNTFQNPQIQPQGTLFNQFSNQPNSKPINQPTASSGQPLGVNIPTLVPGAAEMAKRLIGNPPGGALLVGSNPPIFPIEKRLISNYTKLRPVVTDTFRCNRGAVPNYVGYGYYADVQNECQIFHICLPWKELYPMQFDQDVTYQFSFICPNQTVFSQDVMTCTWKSEALPCEASPELYWLNQNFFRRVPGEFGMKYAEVNEKIVPPLVYDYDEFNPQKLTQG